MLSATPTGGFRPAGCPHSPVPRSPTPPWSGCQQARVGTQSGTSARHSRLRSAAPLPPAGPLLGSCSEPASPNPLGCRGKMRKRLQKTRERRKVAGAAKKPALLQGLPWRSAGTAELGLIGPDTNRLSIARALSPEAPPPLPQNPAQPPVGRLNNNENCIFSGQPIRYQSIHRGQLTAAAHISLQALPGSSAEDYNSQDAVRVASPLTAFCCERGAPWGLGDAGTDSIHHQRPRDTARKPRLAIASRMAPAQNEKEAGTP